MELRKKLKQIYENDGMENSFFIYPFLAILLKHSQSGDYLWMSESFKERFGGKVPGKNINEHTFIEAEYEAMYNDTLSAHGLNFNSSHAISQKITGSESWLKGYINYDAYTKEGEQKLDNSAGLVKPYYKLRQEKVSEVKQALNSIDKSDVQKLISKHQDKFCFTQKDFELFSRWSGKVYDRTNSEHKKAYEALKTIYGKTKEWAQYIVKQRGWNKPKITINPISASANTAFTEYHWAKLYPYNNNDNVFYVVSISSKGGRLGFAVRVETYTDTNKVDKETRQKYCEIRDKSHIESYLPMEDGVGKSFKELGEWALEQFSMFSPSYDEMLNALFPESIDSKGEGKGDSENDQGINENNTINQILYGPPGTGKTYNTVNKSVEIIAPGFIDKLKTQGLPDSEVRTEVKAEFDKYLKTGQIAFTTFHQSYGYEDFVEGIKAETVDTQINYSVEPGIFKQLCEKAVVSDNDSLTKLGEAIEKLKEELTAGKPLRLKTEAQKKEFTLSWRGYTAFYAKPDAGEYDNPVSIESIKKLYMDPDIKSGAQGVHFKIYTAPVIRYLIANYNLPIYQKKSRYDNKPYILIIDEINRGNISKIFGELITLIEPDKREGDDEALTVMLPYSKEPFSVPKNIHIIGTMNTADASIAKLDVALRRRFDFIEMPPEPDLLKGIEIEGVNLSEMLTAINQRVELLYDREHTIGHSFFMKLRTNPTIDALGGVFKKNIIPLLQEYFFDDWLRIHWVLGDHLKGDEGLHFIKKKNSTDELKDLMGKKWSDDNGGSDDIWELNPNAFKQPKSYMAIYSGKGENTDQPDSEEN